MINIKTFQELNHIQIYKILQARSQVFVVEQDCVYQDIDGKDIDAYHCFIEDDQGEIIAYVRLLDKGVSYPEGCSIGRVIVKQSHRRKGLASKLMNRVIEFAFHTKDEERIVISAQQYLIGFYSSLGFTSIGEGYLEDGIPHIQMYLNKTT